MSRRIVALSAAVVVVTFWLAGVCEVPIALWMLSRPHAAFQLHETAAVIAPLGLLVPGAVGALGASVLLLVLANGWTRRSAATMAAQEFPVHGATPDVAARIPA